MEKYDEWEQELQEALELSASPDQIDMQQGDRPAENTDIPLDDWLAELDAMDHRESEPRRPKKNKGKPRPVEKSMLQYAHDLVYLLATVIVVFLLLFRVVVVSGTSMNRTLLDGDYLLVMSGTLCGSYEYGDVIVASKETFDDGKPIVKRVIATEGQWVDIDFLNGIVYVGDSINSLAALEEPYTNTSTTLQEGISFPLQVDDGCIFVLGDNRDNSKDSRSLEIGLIDEREVLGKVIFLFFPGTNGTDASGRPNEPRNFGRIGVVD